MEMLVRYVVENHEENPAVTKSKYETINEFIAWKEKVEKETTSWFVMCSVIVLILIQAHTLTTNLDYGPEHNILQ